MTKKKVDELLEENEVKQGPKELARAYVEQAILKIEWSHIDKQAIKPIVEQVLSYF